MMKIKNKLKKGGVADIVTLMVIVGLVIALIIAVVLPMIRQARNAGGDNSGMISGISTFTDTLANEGGGYGLTPTGGTPIGGTPVVDPDPEG